MLSLEELFSKKNQRQAFEKLSTKKEGSGSDGILMSELEEYWNLMESQSTSKTL